MRVVAGVHKGRQLKAVPGNTTRPTTDKVKEAIFQILGPLFEHGMVLDLYAGSGSLGIEALSRGMEKGIFVDKNPKAIHTIYENVRTIKLDDKVEVYKTEAFRAMNAASKRDLQFDLILLDPPYRKVNYGKLLDEIDKLQLLNKNGMIYCEHDIVDKLPSDSDRFSVVKQDNYGGTIGVTIYKQE
ncbi:16S rRNA (guanine966-N2)-methyltransferase [Virgibacillus subterraneus]|uniref:16S rRNA (Guanine966-N2)-methyltransferase n=1 Tax=Virgibacillus subterraneus TaxID=621109 RepID=A0A1H9HHN0_9BACI|nr:16S rRNA (guanine(966)-N(2))-methyltransferase RsmD [Virgibacillus subterraneus]SEQ61788.1 16S rRNA (guanine966-N2)-methyltransferase [Virgibacillus subterraneus]